MNITVYRSEHIGASGDPVITLFASQRDLPVAEIEMAIRKYNPGDFHAQPLLLSADGEPLDMEYNDPWLQRRVLRVDKANIGLECRRTRTIE